MYVCMHTHTCMDEPVQPALCLSTSLPRQKRLKNIGNVGIPEQQKSKDDSIKQFSIQLHHIDL